MYLHISTYVQTYYICLCDIFRYVNVKLTVHNFKNKIVDFIGNVLEHFYVHMVYHIVLMYVGMCAYIY